MYDRRLTMLGLMLLGATLLLYYIEDGGGFPYVYITGVAMLAVFLASFIRFNMKHLGTKK